ncbi:glycosyltransferase family 4 protein [Pedobacter sp. UBA4863]|uniref:glycosyltransferase family 4 protein n=1 Tax=Pedobacter sp. UBA4863 TaxID=1947060 RepID=UPI002600CCCB|nr:glycosyltransferase family 4 protein [Pedobacter sp. UBA4863]
MLNPKSNILFLSLYTFSLTGGVEKVCKNFIYTLRKLFGESDWANYSMHDRLADLDTNYSAIANYKAFAGKKLSYMLASLKQGLNSKTVILSHINLLLVAKLISVFKPHTKFILFAHGIEVWGNLAKWKTSFIRKNVEVWAVSNYTKQRMIEQHQLSSSQINVLNNCLSPFLNLPTAFTKPKYLLEKYGLAENHPVLFTLNRLAALEQYKGYDVVITALADLKKEGYNFTYLLAGKADAEEQLRIEQLIEANGLNANVKLIGYLAEEELAAYFLLADVFVMPSKGEGFGIVFIEAAAHGCKIIGGNRDGSTDALLNGQLGILVNPTDVNEIGTSLLALMQNKATSEQKIAQQQLSIENFGFEQYVARVERLLN